MLFRSTMKKDKFDEIFDDSDKFGHAYAYTTNGSGISTLYEDKLNDALVIGNGHRIKVGTVGINSEKQYYPYNVNDVKIWDVTNAGTGDDGVKVPDFYTKDYYLELVLDADGNVRTAFINEELSTNGGSSWGGGAHDAHTWPTSLVDSKKAYGFETVGEIGRILADDHDADIQGDWTIDANLYIPEGRIVKVNGDANIGNFRVYGDGVLWVTGDLNVTASTATIMAKTHVGGNLVLSSNNANIDALVQVDGNVTGTSILTVNNDLHVDGDIAVNTLTVNGHAEAETCTTTIVNVNSKNTLIVYGNMEALTSLTMNNGRTEVGGSLTVGVLKMTKSALVLDNTALVVNTASPDMADKDSTIEAGTATINDNCTLAGKMTLTKDMSIADSKTLIVKGASASVTTTKVRGTGTVKTEAGGKLTTTEATNDASKVSGEIAGDFSGAVEVAANSSVEKNEIGRAHV